MQITIDMEQAEELEFEEFLLLNRAADGNLTSQEQVKLFGAMTKLVKEDLRRIKLKDLPEVVNAIMSAWDEIANPGDGEKNSNGASPVGDG